MAVTKSPFNLRPIQWLTASLLTLLPAAAWPQSIGIGVVICQRTCTSADGEYTAAFNGQHYVVTHKKSKRRVLTTADKNMGPNEAKGGAFAMQGGIATFRALYHFNTKGPCTWAGT